MISSPLQILNHYPAKIRLVPLDDGDEKSKHITVGTKFTCAQHTKDKRKYRVDLTVNFGKLPKDRPPENYRGEVTIVGYFEVYEDYPEEHIDKLISVTAVSVLYGSARELICNLTARHPNGCLSIPSVSFIDEAKAQTNRSQAK